MHLTIEHCTRFSFDHVQNYSIQQLHLTPQDGFGQRVMHWEIRVNGQMRPHADPYGNKTHTLVCDTPHQEIEITARGEVETGVETGPLSDAMPLPVYLRQTLLTRVSPELAAFAEPFRIGPDALDMMLLLSLMHALRKHIEFQPEDAPAAIRPAAAAFASAIGSGQELAQVYISACRHLGVPARYVSGYRFLADGSRMVSHGWVDVWLDEAWHSFDVAYGQRANGIHVRLATGLDARDASPVCQAPRAGDSQQSSTIRAQSLAQAQQ